MGAALDCPPSMSADVLHWKPTTSQHVSGDGEQLLLVHISFHEFDLLSIQVKTVQNCIVSIFATDL